MKITGSLVQAYIICPRQAWLMSRNIIGNQYNDFLAIGRLLSDETFKRDKKEVLIDGNKIDIIRSKKDSLKIIETKKSSRMIRASEMQLLFYMYSLRNKVKNITGEIRVPKEKKVFEVELNDGKIKEIENNNKSMMDLFELDTPPVPEKKNYCKTCAHYEFCWA
jgi:CRISPR-associated exonuclease Cas4